MTVFTVSLICAFGVGFSAQRGSLCVVSGIADVVDRRSPRVFMSFFRIGVWVTLLSSPICWLFVAAHPLMTYSLSLLTVVGGLLFGIGAALNGGCSFGTLIRFAAGDLTFIGSFAGMAAGIWSRGRMSMLTAPMPNGPSVLAHPSRLGVLVVCLAALFSIHELALLPQRKRPGSWSPEQAAAVIGLCSGLIYTLNGTWFYTIAFDHLIYVEGARELHGLQLTAVTIATLAGGAISATSNQTFHLRFRWQALPLHIIGGAAMGFGTTLIPGGNAVLVLNAFPALSSHAVPAYFSLIVGAAIALFVSRSLRRAAHFQYHFPAQVSSDADYSRTLSPAID